MGCGKSKDKAEEKPKTAGTKSMKVTISKIGGSKGCQNVAAETIKIQKSAPRRSEEVTPSSNLAEQPVDIGRLTQNDAYEVSTQRGESNVFDDTFAELLAPLLESDDPRTEVQPRVQRKTTRLENQAHCPDQKCSELVLLNELTNHIRNKHKSARWLGTTDFAQYKTQYWNIKCNENFATPNVSWVLTLWNYDDADFVMMFQKHGGKWYGWVYVLGGVKLAEEYTYKIRMTSPPGMTGKYQYEGTVQSVCEKSADIWRNERCLVLSDRKIKLYMTPNSLPEGRRNEGYDHHVPVQYKVVKKKESIFAN